MRSAVLFSFFAAALTANAVLVVPDTGGFAPLVDPSLFPAQVKDGKSVWLDCPSCPRFEGSDHRSFFKRPNDDAELLLHFKTADNGKIVTLNDKEFFSFNKGLPLAGEVVHADYVDPSRMTFVTDVLGMQRSKANPVLEPAVISAHYAPPHEAKQDGMSRFTISTTVYAVNVQMMDELTMTVVIVKDQAQNLRVEDVSAGPRIRPFTGLDASHDAAAPKKSQCTSRLCFAIEQAKAQASKIKAGCKGMMGHKSVGGPEKSVVVVGGPNKIISLMTGNQAPKHHQHNPHHQGQNRPCAHRLMHKIARFVHSVVLPILIGITVGLAISAIGMITGQIIFLIWARLHRKNGGYERVEQAEVGEGRVSEDLPIYDAEKLPEYADEVKTEQA